MAIAFHTTVSKVEKRSRIVRAWRDGDDVRTQTQELGWYILLSGSWESLYVGEDEPEFAVGDEVEVKISRRNQCPCSSSSA